LLSTAGQTPFYFTWTTKLVVPIVSRPWSKKLVQFKHAPKGTKPLKRTKPALIATLEAVGVVLIWMPTLLIMKVGLNYLPPLTLTVLRYTIAGFILMPFLLRQNGGPAGLRKIPAKIWLRLSIMGLMAITISDGFNSLGLTHLPASMVSILSTLAPIVPIIISIFWLKEYPAAWQYVGMLLVLTGCIAFIYPFEIVVTQPLSILFVMISLLAFGIFNLLARFTGRLGDVSTLTVTSVPIISGAIFLWVLVLVFEGIPQLNWQGLAIVFLLAALNTVVGFMLYNHALKRLTLIEMNSIIGLLPITQALLAAFVLKEKITWVQVTAILIVILGVLIVQLCRRKESPAEVVVSKVPAVE
jgi:drug/metabolite transporter (DMT)-like permease